MVRDCAIGDVCAPEFQDSRKYTTSGPYEPGGGGGRENSAYERGGDVRRKFWIEPLKETDLGVAQAFFDP